MKVLVWQGKHQNVEIPTVKRNHGLAAQETAESSWVLCFLLQRALPWSWLQLEPWLGGVTSASLEEEY